MNRRIVLLILVLLLVLNGCSMIGNPPSIQEIENVFYEYREEIQVVTNYLLLLEQSLSIYSSSQELPEDVAQAVKILLTQAGCHSIHGCSTQVCFVLWTQFTDAGCGLYYAKSETPEEYFLYLVQSEAISEPGWYYYVDDCNG